MVQSFKSNEFTSLDLGPYANKKCYGHYKPPHFDLSKCGTPIAIHYSGCDRTVSTYDVERLYNELPNKMGLYKSSCKGISHGDFIYSNRARSCVYNSIVKHLKE